MQLLLAFVLAVAIGLSLGLLGGGGSILTVPIFAYVLHYPAKEAIAMSLPVVGVTSLVGAYRHRLAGTLDLRLGLLYGAVSFGGSRLSAHLARFVPGDVQLALLAVVMLTVAGLMLWGTTASAAAAPSERPKFFRGAHPALAAAAAFAVGLLTGLVGIGGGFLFVPALHLFGRLPMKTAVGTSLVAIACNTAGGFLGYAGQVRIDWPFLALFTCVSILGIFAGTHLQRFVSQVTLRRAFGAFLVVIGALILYDKGRVLARAGRAPAAAATDSSR
jgi:uncharacterized protein